MILHDRTQHELSKFAQLGFLVLIINDPWKQKRNRL